MTSESTPSNPTITPPFPPSSSPSSSPFELFSSLRYDPKLLHESFNTNASPSARPSPYLLFSYHVDRLRTAAAFFDWPRAQDAINVPGVEDALKAKCDDAVRGAEEELGIGIYESGLMIRILLSCEGDFRIQALPTRPLVRGALDAAYFNPDVWAQQQSSPSSPPPQPILKVYLDTTPTPPSPHTSYKTTARELYAAAQHRAHIRPGDRTREVLLYDPAGALTEGAVRNVAFWRDGRWVTPPASGDGLSLLQGTVRRWLLERGLLEERVVLRSDVHVGEWVLLTNAVDVTILGRVEELPALAES